MIYIGVFIAFLSMFTFMYGILNLLSYDKLNIKKRIKQIRDVKSGVLEDLENRSFLERMLRPVYNSFCQLILKITPGYKLTVLNKKLERAGMQRNNSTIKWLFTKFMTAVILSVMFGLLIYMLEPNILKAGFIAILIGISANAVFNFYISKRIELRKKSILKSLPYTLDLITVSVEAGLSFDGAMARVVSNINGELCEEFSKCLKEIRMGIERKMALKSLSERCDVRELTMFITSLIQADNLGVSLGRVLRIEASNLREHRKQAAREKAMKAPVKMLFPLIFFIFPSIFIIILGPVVIKMINVFMR